MRYVNRTGKSHRERTLNRAKGVGLRRAGFLVKFLDHEPLSAVWKITEGYGREGEKLRYGGKTTLRNMLETTAASA